MAESTRRWSAAGICAVVALALSACNGGASGTAPGSTAPNALPPMSSQGAMTPDTVGPVNIYPGEIVGRDGAFAPQDGDMKNGGLGQPVSGVTCDATEHTSQYHVHAYLGIIANGKQLAVPDTIGMKNPGPEQNGYTSSAGCFYWIHTHDASGMIHIEVPKTYPITTKLYKLEKFLKIWGIARTSSSFGAYKGTINVYVGNPAAPGDTTVSSYKKFAGDLGNVPVGTHTVVWLEIGGNQLGAKALPPVTFYTEY